MLKTSFFFLLSHRIESSLTRRDKLGVLTKLMRYVFLMENQVPYSFYFFFYQKSMPFEK